MVAQALKNYFWTHKRPSQNLFSVPVQLYWFHLHNNIKCLLLLPDFKESLLTWFSFQVKLNPNENIQKLDCLFLKDKARYFASYHSQYAHIIYNKHLWIWDIPCSFPLHTVVVPFSTAPSPSELGLSNDSFCRSKETSWHTVWAPSPNQVSWVNLKGCLLWNKIHFKLSPTWKTNSR